MTPYYQDAAVTLYHGDCREILPELERPSIVVADPPYGVSMLRGDSKVRSIIHGDGDPFDPAHLLGLDVPTVIFGANQFARLLPVSGGWIVWDKTFPDSARFSQAELAWTNYLSTVRIYREAYHGFMRQRDGWHHPTQKPVKLFTWILEAAPPGLVVDPYCGSGPVLIAAKDLGRRAIGIEIEERYCEIAAKRCSQEVLPL